jgi:hypothetical protein
LWPAVPPKAIEPAGSSISRVFHVGRGFAPSGSRRDNGPRHAPAGERVIEKKDPP